MSTDLKHIAHLLPNVLAGSATHVEINQLVRIAHHLAVIRLKQLIGSGRLHLQSFPLTVESIAFDCIAEIFERDGEGVFIELHEYFSVERDLRALDLESSIIAFRALVFTKLNDGIFRLYRENDPVLSKIIRNIKIALEKIPHVHSQERFGIHYIVFTDEQAAELHLPEISIEEAENALTGSYHAGGSTTAFLMALGGFLESQDTFRKALSLYDCAVVLKRISAVRNIPLQDVFEADQSVFQSDIRTIVENSIRQIRSDLSQRYLVNGKLTSTQFDAYLSAIEEMVRDTFIRSDGSERSYDQYLQQFISTMTYDDYRSHHRIHFEYMSKLAKKEVKNRLRELLG